VSVSRFRKRPGDVAWWECIPSPADNGVRGSIVSSPGPRPKFNFVNSECHRSHLVARVSLNCLQQLVAQSLMSFRGHGPSHLDPPLEEEEGPRRQKLNLVKYECHKNHLIYDLLGLGRVGLTPGPPKFIFSTTTLIFLTRSILCINAFR